MSDFEDDIEEFDEENDKEDLELELEDHKRQNRRKYSKSKLYFSKNIQNLIGEASSIRGDKKVAILVPTISTLRTVRTGILDRSSDIQKATEYTIDNLEFITPTRRLIGKTFDYAIIHAECDAELLSKLASVMKLTNLEFEEISTNILKVDADRELCKICEEENPESTPYGEETGNIEAVPQFDKDGNPLVDEEGTQLYMDFPEFECEKGHRWFKGEGKRRNWKGKNPVKLESHMISQQRRNIYADAGVVDPAFTLDRFGRPIKGSYWRSLPDGRQVNTKEARKNGAGWYK